MRAVCSIAWSLTQLAFMLAAQVPAKQHPQALPNQHLQAAAKQRAVTDVTTHAPTTEPAGYYALVIGNNNYWNTDKLVTAISDANAVAQLLRQRYGFETKVLLDATRTDILRSLVEYRRTLPENSNLLIYYAGHGHHDRKAEKAYWLPVDAEKDSNLNWVSADDITADLRAIPSRHVLVISDSCYSGVLARDANVDITPIERSAYLNRMSRSMSRTLMSSGSDEPVSDSGGGAGHSVFAGAILQGLREMEDNQFTAAALFQKIQPRVAGKSEQLPQYSLIRDSGHEDGDFVFTRVGNEEPPKPRPDPHDVPPVIEVPPPDVRKNVGSDDDRNRIDDVLHQYELAYNSKNATALWKIWPGAPIERRQPIEAYFRNAQSIRSVLQMGTPEISADHMTAVVKGRNHVSYTPKAGSSPPAAEGSITFTLRSDGSGGWTIVGVDFSN